MYFIEIPPTKVEQALESWSWIGLQSKKSFRITSFGSVFLASDDGVWFLDTLEGSLTKVCDTPEDIDELLLGTEAKDRFLLAAFVERAERDGLKLEAEQCYNFQVHPILGGAFSFENMITIDFMVAIHIAGQLHDKVRRLPPGTKIDKFQIVDTQMAQKKPWWKIW